MVSTRGKQPTAASNSAATIIADATDARILAMAEPTLRKRRRSASRKAEQAATVAKRQMVSDPSESAPVFNETMSSPRTTRQQPAADTNQTLEHIPSAGRGSLDPNNAAPAFASVNDSQAVAPGPTESGIGLANKVGDLEKVNPSYSSQGYEEMGVVDTASLLPQGASLHIKIQSLPVLDNLVIP